MWVKFVKKEVDNKGNKQWESEENSKRDVIYFEQASFVMYCVMKMENEKSYSETHKWLEIKKITD